MVSHDWWLKATTCVAGITQCLQTQLRLQLLSGIEAGWPPRRGAQLAFLKLSREKTKQWRRALQKKKEGSQLSQSQSELPADKFRSAVFRPPAAGGWAQAGRVSGVAPETAAEGDRDPKTKTAGTQRRACAQATSLAARLQPNSPTTWQDQTSHWRDLAPLQLEGCQPDCRQGGRKQGNAQRKRQAWSRSPARESHVWHKWS